MKRLLVFLTVVFLVAPTAEAVLLDFEDLPPFGEEFPSYSKAGVTITAVGGGNLMAQPFQNGTWGITGWPMPFPELRADFDVPPLFIKVDLADAGGDSDLAFLEVFNKHDVSLAYTDYLIPADSKKIVTLELVEDGIAYAILGARNALNGSSIAADNFEFEPIPEPTTIVLLTLGGLGLLRRRKS
ncbi:MAG: PEP-CTERM sorting domain-containing protein [Phycisphaerales bacterium]|nr:MAG: PEP-CTERM sorting domain-containing protein [Phycisphaerales bacterium]